MLARQALAEILCRHVTKAYEGEQGLFDFHMELEKGKAFGLLGPSGAGKSTAISLLMGFIRPDEGELSIQGQDCFSQRHALMQHIGFVPRDARLPRRSSGEQFMRLLSGARGLDTSQRATEIMEKLDLAPLGDWQYMDLAGRRKVQLMLGLMTKPDILLLDEPCAGLDANSRNAVLALIREEKERGCTIFMTSHVFEEVQQSCDWAGIIRGGRLVTVQPTQALSHTRQKVYHITFESLAEAAAFAQEWETGVELLRNRVIVAVPASPQVLLKTLAKYQVVDLIGGREEMEESFLRAYGGDLL